jgi:2-succinyl-5-enolpyruvyl-6-hydroxy-3-cyclohexene-1-carboxylate synthase
VPRRRADPGAAHAHPRRRARRGLLRAGHLPRDRRPRRAALHLGTAGAHWLPAVIEAAQAHHPLLLITADRPWEAYDCAAPQTIDQTDLFGRYVRHRAELGLPDPDPGALRAVVRIAAQSAHAARWPTPGPVHVNARFRKPLEPVAVEGPEAWAPLVQSLCAARVYAPSRSVPEGAAEALAEAIARHPRGVLSCGPSDGAVFPVGPVGAHLT